MEKHRRRFHFKISVVFISLLLHVQTLCSKMSLFYFYILMKCLCQISKRQLCKEYQRIHFEKFKIQRFGQLRLQYLKLKSASSNCKLDYLTLKCLLCCPWSSHIYIFLRIISRDQFYQSTAEFHNSIHCFFQHNLSKSLHMFIEFLNTKIIFLVKTSSFLQRFQHDKLSTQQFSSGASKITFLGFLFLFFF